MNTESGFGSGLPFLRLRSFDMGSYNLTANGQKKWNNSAEGSYFLIDVG